jgi:hypothetical protein
VRSHRDNSPAFFRRLPVCLPGWSRGATGWPASDALREAQKAALA